MLFCLSSMKSIRKFHVFIFFLSITDAFGAYYRCAKDRVPCGCSFSDVETMTRIIHGEDTLPYSWSMMVTVRPYGSSLHECGGTIISDSHVLTAARCLENVNLESPELVSIAGSIHFLAEKTSTVRRVDAIHIHPQWDYGAHGFAHDLAILHLSRPLNFSEDPYISQACIPPRDLSVPLTEHPRNGSQLMIIGWGSKKPSVSNELTQSLQQTTIQAIHHDDSSCADSIHDPRLQFCAGFSDKIKGPCAGDAGGPVMEWDEDHWNQVGIISYKPVDCETTSHQAIYTRLAAYYNWIQSVLRLTKHTLSYVPTISSTTEKPVIERPKPYQCNQSLVQCGCGMNRVELGLSRIVGGHEAVPYSWSMIVSLTLRNSSEHICGGSILNDRFILTAAHCVDTQLISETIEFSVVVGIHDRFEENQTVRNVDHIVIHPDWNYQKDHCHDIAILHLSEPLNLQNNPRIFATCVPHLSTTEETINYPMNGSSLLVIGWGTLQSGDQAYAPTLQQVEVFTIDNKDPICQDSIDDPNFQFCAGLHHGRKDSCQGDSGGPILQWNGDHWQQVGITSYGQGCAEAGFPGIYTRLAHYTTWIESIINSSLTTTRPTPTTAKPPRKYVCNENASCGCGLNDVSISLSRIVGGEDAVPFSWSMVVSIRFGNPSEHACGGTILTEKFILTAAHCVGRLEVQEQNRLFVVAGLHNQLVSSPTPMIRRVRQFYIHPEWNKTIISGTPNDIAILELVRPLDIGLSFRTARTCLPQMNKSIDISQYPSNHTRLMVIGWGVLEFRSFFSVTETLQQAQIFLIDNNDPSCNSTLKNPQSQLCAGLPDGGKGTCQGDSGGPIFHWMNDHWEQIGLTSYARGCAQPGHPTVFTRIAYFEDWIQSIINPTQLSTTWSPITETIYECNRQSSKCGCSMNDVIMTNGIQGNEEVLPFSWSMVVSLQSLNGTHLCSATILSDWYMLTAAHCLSEIKNYQEILIHSGIHLLSQDDALQNRIAHVFIHPSYSDRSPFLHNVAVIKVQSSLDINHHVRLSLSCLPNVLRSFGSEINKNSTLVAVGWNAPLINENRLQQVLVKAMDVIDPSCRMSIDNEQNQFCVHLPMSEGDTCIDDSGSPIFSYENGFWMQVGILSYRKNCRESDSTEIFTRLTSYIGWIETVTKNISKSTMEPLIPSFTTNSITTLATTTNAVNIQPKQQVKWMMLMIAFLCIVENFL